MFRVYGTTRTYIYICLYTDALFPNKVKHRNTERGSVSFVVCQANFSPVLYSTFKSDDLQSRVPFYSFLFYSFNVITFDW